MTTHVLNNYLLSPIQALSRLLKGLFTLIADWHKAYKRYKAVKKTINELRALTDAELNDIGIGRGDIKAIAHGDPTHKRSAQTNNNLEGWV